MTKILLTTILTFITATSFGQWQWGMDFENPYYLTKVSFDTASNPNCIWQVGHPTKTVFTAAHSIPNSLVTDTLNSVPANDTSTFYLLHERDNLAPFHVFGLHFWFQLDGDSTDYGIIEVSPDNGLNWINLLTQDTTYQFNWQTTKPTLSGSTNGWQQFNLEMNQWASGWGSFPIAMTADTIRFKFTYTDSSLTAKDGWIMDDFLIEDVWEGIEEVENYNLITIYPNPVKGQLSIKTDQISSSQSIQITNYQGQVLYDNKDFHDNLIDITHLTNGLYFLRYSDTKAFSIKKFIVNH
jgi:hypothetical protein